MVDTVVEGRCGIMGFTCSRGILCFMCIVGLEEAAILSCDFYLCCDFIVVEFWLIAFIYELLLFLAWAMKELATLSIINLFDVKEKYRN